MKNVSKETQIVHGIHTCHVTSMDLTPPIHMTSAFRFNSVEHGSDIFSGDQEGYIYTRVSNPTVDLLQEKMAVLEGGEAALATSSGMSAVASVALTLARPGDNIISCTTLYGGTFALFNQHLRDFNIITRYLSPAGINSAMEIERLIDKNTRFLYMETPANPSLSIVDIELWASIAAKNNLPLVVDNTFASPYLQQPLHHGATLVVHSATKYLGGHGDIIGGVIIGSKEMTGLIKERYLTHFGPVMSPFNAWLVLRGLKTLAVRMEKHCDNAFKIAQWLEQRHRVANVCYPGLKSHTGHQIACRQMKKYGGMVSFEVEGGLKAGRIVMDNVKLCILAVSLGDCETLIQHPATMTHATYTPEQRAKAGIADGLVRLSVGIENADDVIKDLDQAFSVQP